MISWTIGYWFIGEVLTDPDYLTNAYAQKNRIFFGVLFELVDVAAVMGITVLMYPIIKKFNETLALGYVALRILECALLIIAIMGALSVITLSREFIAAGSPDNTHFQTLGTTMLEIRENWVHLVLPFFYSLASFIFYYFFYKTKLIPRPIAIWGLIASSLVLTGIPMDFFEFKPGAFVGAAMGLTELVLGIWLIVKGFNTPEGDLT